MSYTYTRVYEFTKLVVQKAGSTISGTSATDTFTAGAAHGLTVGWTLTPLTAGDAAMSGVTPLTRYFVHTVGTTTTFKVSATAAGSAISLGTAGGTTPATWKAAEEYRIYLANQAQLNPENTDYTWEGDAQQLKLTLTRGMPLTLSADAIPASAHKSIFAKPAVTETALPGGGTSAYGYGGGNDKSGASCGIRLEANGIENVDGVETVVTFVRWFPMGTLTFTGPAGLQTGQKMGVTGYTFTPVRTRVDVVGAAITGGSSDGEFFYDYKIAS